MARAFRDACLDELQALKPGNVGRHGDGHGMTAALFETSAAVSAPFIGDPRLTVGERVLGAVEATVAAAGCNTNLGIVLLCAPLARAAQTGHGPLRARLAAVLAGLDRHDTDGVFRAIRRAAPAGLGDSARHDVNGPADADLVAVMRFAADRDRIARQYATDFADIFDGGLAALDWAEARWQDKSWTTVYIYLSFLARFHDTHVLRKLGASTAEELRRTGGRWRDRLAVSHRPSSLVPELMSFDRELKTRGINPGTSADLTVATLLAKRLKSMFQEEN